MNNSFKMNKYFVFVVDSPSHEDYYNGRHIGKALANALLCIGINKTFYTETSNINFFIKAITEKLPQTISDLNKSEHNVNYIPFIHICMHGSTQGLAFSSGEHLDWSQLRSILSILDNQVGYLQNLCFASCYGKEAVNMNTIYDGAFNFMIGNSKTVYQSDLTIAYLAFYSHFFKTHNLYESVNYLKMSTSDNFFWFLIGEEERQKKIQNSLISRNPNLLSSNFGVNVNI